MDIQRAILVREQYNSLPIEAKQYVDALVLEAKQNPKSKYLEHFYRDAIKSNVMDTYIQLKYNDVNDDNDVKIDWISFVAFKAWLLIVTFLTGVSTSKELKKDANLFMLSIAIASNFVVEGDYKERYHALTYNF
ncbi:MAG: hypothetical protein IM507_22795 [Microcystis sp. M20BS1]|uniref:hypothetical protein n=1 Tax=unclassified Microcystis TaxID=2643300 RepID=UPI00257ED53C|nr:MULTISPECIES: hypothetical protein [unclassified Microcystis]MCA2626002.1 hypothetical protein [Microcystis sp. M19BS1]MCA2635104.1 hypothetical protein [Microcystis sp. M20BS1]